VRSTGFASLWLLASWVKKTVARRGMRFAASGVVWPPVDYIWTSTRNIFSKCVKKEDLYADLGCRPISRARGTLLHALHAASHLDARLTQPRSTRCRSPSQLPGHRWVLRQTPGDENCQSRLEHDRCMSDAHVKVDCRHVAPAHGPNLIFYSESNGNEYAFYV
jgi:hypothetical protein